MEFLIEIRREDYSYFNNFHTIKRGSKRRIIILTIVLSFLVLMDITSSSAVGKSFELSEYTIMFILYIVLYYPFFLILMRSKVNKIMKTSPTLLGKKRIYVDESGIKENGEFDEGFIKWEGFIEFFETKTHFILYNTIISAVIIPKRDLDKEKTVNEFRDILNIKTNQLKIKYSSFN